MIFGYARVSTEEQELAGQVDALKAASCDEIISEKMTGTRKDRPELIRLFDKLRAGDVVVVTRLDRLGRSMKDLIELVEQLKSQGVGFKSLHEQFDTTSAAGLFVFHMFGALAEFERALISERTKAGLKAARARGRNGGRPKALDSEQIKLAKSMLTNPNITVSEVARNFKVSRSTIYREIGVVSICDPSQKSP